MMMLVLMQGKLSNVLDCLSLLLFVTSILFYSGPNACEDRGCDRGTLAIGWGSGTAEFPYLVTVSTCSKLQD